MEAALLAGSRIGRYFGLVSVVPSALFVAFVYSLVRSGAWTGRPHLAAIDISVEQASLLLLLVLALSLLLHPLQFPLIQLLEGYWGTSRAARWLAGTRIRHHRARSVAIGCLADRCAGVLQAVADHDAERGKIRTLEGDAGIEYVPAIVDREAFLRARQAYPEDHERVMPTRLGNVLRRHEDLAGAQYGLKAITVGPHLALLAEPRRAAYLNDAREELDLTVRLCGLSMLASGVAFAFLVTDGLWLLVAAAPYLLAYVFYRGSVAAASNYMLALATVIDLDRWELYKQLHLEWPDTTEIERTRNTELMDLLEFETTPVVSYDHTPGAASSVPERG